MKRKPKAKGGFSLAKILAASAILNAASVPTKNRKISMYLTDDQISDLLCPLTGIKRSAVSP